MFVLPGAFACSGDGLSKDGAAVETQGSQAVESGGLQDARVTAARELREVAADGGIDGAARRGAAAASAGDAGASNAANRSDDTRANAAEPSQVKPPEHMERAAEVGEAADSSDDAGLTESTARSGAGAGGVGASGAGGAGGTADAGATRTPGAGGFGGGVPFCVHPASCVPVITSTVGMETCCPNNGEPCGYSVLYPAELDDGTCRPNSAVFLKLPGQAEERVETPGAPDQLITPECETRSLLAFTLPGCCMPDDRCGVSTYHVADILLFLGGVPAPFTRVQCTSVDTLNRQFRVTPLAGLGQIPPSDGTCDFSALDAKLPRREAAP